LNLKPQQVIQNIIRLRL